MKKLLLLLLIASHFKFLYAEYFSPGIQVGINSKIELFFSFQLTLGKRIVNDFEWTGITFGRRFYIRDRYNFTTYNYIDLQHSFITYGAGIGIVFKESRKFFKYKLFGGFSGLLCYDFINFKNKPKNHLGVIGVTPLPVSIAAEYLPIHIF